MTARALFAGPGALRALVDAREGVVELVLTRSAYVRLGADWVALAEPGMPFGPLSVSICGIGRVPLSPGTSVRVERRHLILGDAVVGLVRVRARRAPAVGFLARSDVAAIRAAGGAARDGLPAPGARLRDGVAALGAGRVEDAVGLLAGCGEGLTPVGDDVLAGYAATRLALQGLPTREWSRPADPAALSKLAAGRACGLGLAYLRCAELGELPEAAANLLAAICRGSRQEVRVALGSLREWGASSGAAIGWGITAAVSERLGLPFEPAKGPARARCRRLGYEGLAGAGGGRLVDVLDSAPFGGRQEQRRRV
jgi:Protein of unknown function (DUF2877)